MEYAKEFFGLQLRFAESVAQLTNRPLAECVQSYTAFHGCFGLGTNFDWEAPLWKHYISGLESADDPLEWTYQNYQAIQAQITAPIARFWGCFSYNLHFDDPTVIRPHFANHDHSGLGAFSSARKAARIEELTAMFSDIRRDAPQARSVRGESWLYNRPAYTRLFPDEYIATAHAIEPAFQFRGLWGQFVDSEGQVREEDAATFLQKLSQQQSTEMLAECFPYQILRAEWALESFYRFYGLSA